MESVCEERISEMTSEGIAVLVAVLGFLGTLVGSLLSANKTQAIMSTKFEDFEKRTDEKFAEVKDQVKKLEDKQDKHNKVIERTYALEGRMTEAEHDIKDLKAKEK